MSWPTAIVVTVALVVMGVLAIFGVDTSNLTWVLLSVLGGLGVGELKAIKEQTNGSNTKLLEEVAQHRQILAGLVQNPPAPVATARVDGPEGSTTVSVE